MPTTDPTTGFLIHTTGDTIVTLADYINASINPINDWAKQRLVRGFKPADATALAALAGMTQGDQAYELDNNQSFTYTGSAWKRNTGMVRVVPTAVSGTGVTVATDGVISLSANTAASPAYITNGFPLDKKYRIIVDNSASSTNHIPTMQFGAAGAAINSANYDLQALNASGASPTSGQSLAQTSWTFSFASQVAHFVEIDITRANNASAAKAIATGFSTLDTMTAAATGGSRFLNHRLTTAYQDAVFAPSGAGTWTGTIEIWMYN